MSGAERIRLCHLIPRLHQGGAEAQVLLGLEAADRQRFEVHLCVMKAGERELEDRARALVSSMECLDFRWRHALADAVRFRRWLGKRRIQILHCHLPLADSFGRVASLGTGVGARFTTEHGKHLWKRWPHRLLDRVLNHHTYARICVSEDIARIRREREGLSAAQSPVIPNAVDLGRLRSAQKSPAKVRAEFGWSRETDLVVAVGRLVVAKDYPHWIEAFELLHARRPSARGLIAGGGPLLGQLEALIREKGLRDVLRLAGPRSDVPELLRAADVYLLSSVREGLPVAMLEAMACGIPVVATPAGGVVEVLEDGVHGRRVDSGTVADLARAVEVSLSDRRVALRMAEEASRRVSRDYEISRTTVQVETLYLESLDLVPAPDEFGAARPHGPGEER